MEPAAVKKVSAEVTPETTAQAVGSGDAPVFSTPMMAALMEQAALRLAAGLLEPNETTVGVSLEIRHLAATPVGMTVEAAATLLEREGRQLLFAVEARDEAGLIGEGTHRRAVVDRQRFMEKAAARKR